MSSVVLIGGFTETHRTLKPVINAILDKEIAQEVHVVEQIDGVVKPKILDAHPDEPGSSISGLTVITHSDGARFVKPEHGPKEIIAYAGTEPMTESEAKKKMVRKIGIHAITLWQPRNFVMSYESTKSFIRHFDKSRKAAREIIKFSMKDHLASFVEAGITAYAILSEHDEFNKPTKEYLNELDAAGVKHVVIPNVRHDHLIMQPGSALDAIKHFDY